MLMVNKVRLAPCLSEPWGPYLFTADSLGSRQRCNESHWMGIEAESVQAGNQVWIFDSEGNCLWKYLANVTGASKLLMLQQSILGGCFLLHFN